MFEFRLPEDFLLGTANSAFQSEGAWDRDGKSMSMMDYYARAYAGKLIPGKIPGKAKEKTKGQYTITEELPNDGCFFYDNYEAYIEDMKKTGQNTFRLSISWPRLIPDGVGEVNPKAVDFYNRVINKLIECNIEPMVDLLHWDPPMCLVEQGGYTNENFPEWFENYARICFHEFGDRVKLWSTFNESCVVAWNGYIGRFPPFIIDEKQGLLASHHIIVAHLRAVRAYREMGFDGKIGSVNAMVPVYPAHTTEEDIGAAIRQALFKFEWWLEPMLEGHYPQRVLDEAPIYREMMPEHYQEDLDRWFEPMDFIGLNYYFPERTEYTTETPLYSVHVENFYSSPDSKYTPYPAGLLDLLIYMNERHKGVPIYITENGIGLVDHGDEELDCNDDTRISYLREHLRMVARAARMGIPVKGYYYWNDADSYEQLTGYDHRFGLTWVDHKTGRRRWKKSRYYFKNICETGMVD